MKQAGYSGTPLVKKLGIKEGAKLFPVNAPEDYLEWLEPLPNEVTVLSRAGKIRGEIWKASVTDGP